MTLPHCAPATSGGDITNPSRAPLPGHWRPWQRRKNTFLWGLILSTGWVWRHVPVAFIRPLARIFGTLAWGLARRERRLARSQVAMAFPHWGGAKCAQTVRHMFVHLAHAILESGRLDVLLRRSPLPDSARRVLDEALAEGRGVVVASGHIGNWELLGQAVAQAGYPAHTVAKPLYDPRLTVWVNKLRRQLGLRIIWRGAQGAAKDLLRVFRRGEILALLIDQDTRVEGAFVPFFGRPAFTPTAAATLARRFNAPIIVAWTHRQDTRHHSFYFERVSFSQTADPEHDVRQLTQRLTQRLEQAIRACPHQWVWLHDRHKRQQNAGS